LAIFFPARPLLVPTIDVCRLFPFPACLELLQVAGFVVGLAVFPAAEEDADPFEGQGADGGVVAVSAAAEVVVEGRGPGTLDRGGPAPIFRSKSWRSERDFSYGQVFNSWEALRARRRTSPAKTGAVRASAYMRIALQAGDRCKCRVANDLR
jgi:hypothetical protein